MARGTHTAHCTVDYLCFFCRFTFYKNIFMCSQESAELVCGGDFWIRNWAVGLIMTLKGIFAVVNFRFFFI